MLAPEFRYIAQTIAAIPFVYQSGTLRRLDNLAAVRVDWKNFAG